MIFIFYIDIIKCFSNDLNSTFNGRALATPVSGCVCDPWHHNKKNKEEEGISDLRYYDLKGN